MLANLDITNIVSGMSNFFGICRGGRGRGRGVGAGTLSGLTRRRAAGQPLPFQNAVLFGIPRERDGVVCVVGLFILLDAARRAMTVLVLISQIYSLLVLDGASVVVGRPYLLPPSATRDSGGGRRCCRS